MTKSHPQSADAPEAKKPPLSVGKAVDAILALITLQREAERKAIEAVGDRFAARRAAIYERVPKHLMGAVDGALNAMCTPPPLPGEPDDEPSAGDVVDDVPSRPSLEEYELPAGARDFVPGPAAIAARKR